VFLNQRLNGMRFHEKVQVPDHPLHKALAGFSRPGRAGVLDRLRVKRLGIDKHLRSMWMVAAQRQSADICRQVMADDFKGLDLALTNPASPDRCTAETALIKAVRAAPRRVPDEVLKGL